MYVNSVTKHLVYWSCCYLHEFDEQDTRFDSVGGAMSSHKGERNSINTHGWGWGLLNHLGVIYLPPLWYTSLHVDPTTNIICMWYTQCVMSGQVNDDESKVIRICSCERTDFDLPREQSYCNILSILYVWVEEFCYQQFNSYQFQGVVQYLPLARLKSVPDVRTQIR